MNSNFNVGELAKLAQKLLKGQEFMLHDVYRQTREAYEKFPEDPVIRQVAFTIEKMAEKSSSISTISQADLSEIYNNFVRLSNDSKFRVALGHLLLEDKPTSQNYNPDYSKLNRVDADNSALNTNDFVDKNLVGALDVAFGGSSSVKAYDQKLAELGKEFVELELTSLGFKQPHVEVMGGDENTLVYGSHFDTTNGLVTVAIPIDLQNGKLVLPSTFVADDHLEELNSTSINKFINAKSSIKDFSTPKVKDILVAVGILTGRNKVASQDEFSTVKNEFKDGDSIQLSVPSLFVDRKYEDPRPDIDTKVQVEMPKELAHLAQDFENDVLEAASAFGRKAIGEGKEIVSRELVAAGFKNAQVRFGSESNDSVIYLAAINTPKGPVTIEVPIEMVQAQNKYVPLIPTYFAYDGLIEDFTPHKLQRFAINLPSPSTKNVVAYTASYSYMTLPELKDEILKAASENDYVTCETILSHVEEKFSEEDHKNAIADYQYLLITKARIASKEQHKCSRPIKAGKGSLYDRCGHYLVTMDKVAAGPNGECILKSSLEREKLNPIDESGVLISTSKINFT